MFFTAKQKEKGQKLGLVQIIGIFAENKELMTELNLTLILDSPNISEDIKRAIKMLKGVVSISENTSGNEDVKKKKQMLADKLCGSVHIDQKSVESDDRLNYILEK